MDYLGEAVRFAGFDVVSEKNSADLVLYCGKDSNIPAEFANFPVIHLDFGVLKPMKAANLANYIKKQIKSALMPADKIEIGTGMLDVRENMWFGADGEAVRLTDKESGILLCLAQAKGAAVGRQELLDRVWAYAEGVETHTLETHIYRLRQKIEPDPANPVILLTAEQGYSVPVRV
ncbi:MAG: hypothetical protein DI626_07515 [Micavibrio aeruginosavorus]|uniref:OmpR/PhoB-type domain-containing protein n=1 Tax=Micavibrio aeruginosavorus TaxID=349221 RepID=A0A2W4ZSI3_9BACT|nr:MAG: hypothetical protein DI626_07515 [Micavibrio aeruginosavorus]